MSDTISIRIWSFLSKRKWVFVLLFIVTPAGFVFKSYSGPAHEWFNNYGAGVIYEIFWCLTVFFFLLDRKYIKLIAVSIFVITCILETLQLWHPYFLQQIRHTFLGAALLGTTFIWWDFPHYVLGCLVGWFLMRTLSK